MSMRRVTSVLATAWADLARPGWRFWAAMGAALAAEAAVLTVILRLL